MRYQWTMAAVLGTAVLAGCNDNNGQIELNIEQNQAGVPPAGTTTTEQVNPP